MTGIHAKLKTLLAEATPGPWEADGAVWNRIVCSATNRVCFVAHSDGLNDERDISTSELVALAPSLAAALLKAEEALESTAEQALWAEIPEYNRDALESGEFQRGYDAAISLARAVLAEIKALTGGGNG